MTKVLVCGGNSGIGLEASRELLARGAQVVIVGRSKEKGEKALRSFGRNAERATFIAADLSTLAGVKAAAAEILAHHESFDAILHTTGILSMENNRTVDGLNELFAVNYLSRYHLTQLLLPALRRDSQPRVVMMIAKVGMKTKIDFADFPKFLDYKFGRSSPQINAANLHYAAHLEQSDPEILAGVVNAGVARTDIMRTAPGFMRVMAKVLGPLIFNSVQDSAHNAVEACIGGPWSSGTYWVRPGDFQNRQAIDVDPAVTRQVIEKSRELTSV